MSRLKIGIRAHDLNNSPFSDFKSLVKEAKALDLDYLQLVFKKAFNNFIFDENNLVKLSQTLKDNNIKVAMIGAYFNMVHSDEVKKKKDIEYFKWCLKYSNLFDCHLVGSETGSYNNDKWTYNPQNHTLKAYKEVLDVAKDLQEYGSKVNSNLICEGAYAHVIYSPVVLFNLVREAKINYVTLDIFNYLNIDNYKDHVKIFDEAISLLKNKITIFHVKDFIVTDNTLKQVGIGEGLMNFNYIIPKLMKEVPNVILILEGVISNKIDSSIKYLRGFENDR